MFQVSILALLATMALAGPLSPQNSLLENRSPSAQSGYISACEAADNCETYIDPTTGQPIIRFKAGMEPGTEDYTSRLAKSKSKRQSGYPQTQVTVGDTTVYWGCGTDPIATLSNVSSICATSGQCINTDAWSTSVTYATPDLDVSSPEIMTITAQGTYPTWIRDGLVEGVQAAMSAPGVITYSVVNYMVTTGPINKNGPQTEGESCIVANAPDFIGLGVYSSANTLEATIAVSIAVQTPDNGFCATVGPASSFTGAISGAFGPVGAGIAAIFGIISAACTVAPSG